MFFSNVSNLICRINLPYNVQSLTGFSALFFLIFGFLWIPMGCVYVYLKHFELVGVHSLWINLFVCWEVLAKFIAFFCVRSSFYFLLGLSVPFLGIAFH